MTENMMRQAQNIWSMLDEMAANDPENYKIFIEKNLKENKELMSQPKEHMCIETVIMSESKIKNDEFLFINIMEWSVIPDSKSDVDPISICGGILYEDNFNGKDVNITSVAFNPAILAKYGNKCKNIEEKNMLIYLTFEFLENLNNFKLKKLYKFNKENIKGKLSLAIANLHLSIKNKKICSGSLGNNIQTNNDSEKDGLLINIPNKCSSISNKIESNKPLIEVISTELFNDNENLDNSNENETNFHNYLLPKYFKIKIGNELKIRIELPGVLSVNECQLDIGPTDLVLIVVNKYYLNINFEYEVSIQDVEAFFSKKSSLLTISIPIIN